MKVTKANLTRFVALSSKSYDDVAKKEYQALGRKLLKALAEIMGLQKGEFDIRWNPGGIACAGDHTLHTDWFYLALHDNLGMGWFYYRTCKSRKDYTGGHNQIVSWSEFTSKGLEGLAEAIKQRCPRHVGTEGQDRESYSDTQDRKSYTVSA